MGWVSIELNKRRRKQDHQHHGQDGNKYLAESFFIIFYRYDAGFLVCLDEAVNLFKLTNSVSRNSNYEKILSIVNDSLQGRSGYFGFIFGGTPEFLEDQRRGLFSYEALRTRLSGSRYATGELRDYAGPVPSTSLPGC